MKNSKRNISVFVLFVLAAVGLSAQTQRRPNRVTDRQVSTGTTIQLARQAQRGVQPRLILTSGQTQIVGMYDQDVTTTTDSGQGSSKFLGLGGEQISNKRRVRLFLAVTATILPQNNAAPAVIAESK